MPLRRLIWQVFLNQAVAVLLITPQLQSGIDWLRLKVCLVRSINLRSC
ncbi:Unknown protein sequence [Pseudomonas syringae pv. syringae]|nr:Unknown protein sequence [Pseudomonas syringae pv. syringae]